MKFILGKKLGMTQVWQGDEMVAVTKIQAGPCVIVQVKDKKKDGYTAIQLGYGTRKAKNLAKPQLGHMKDLGNFRYLREFRTETAGLEKGAQITVETFVAGDKIDVVGTSKGKGFQGVVKRHGFAGHKTSHGTKDQVRTSGSIGSQGPQHVFKGVKMAGHMGNERVTVKNLQIVSVDAENGIIMIKGAVPGPVNGFLMVQGEGELKLKSDIVETVVEAPEESTESEVSDQGSPESDAELKTGDEA